MITLSAKIISEVITKFLRSICAAMDLSVLSRPDSTYTHLIREEEVVAK
jgi:hypothetical protein